MATFTTIHPFVSTLRIPQPGLRRKPDGPTAGLHDGDLQDDWSRDPALGRARAREGDAAAEVMALSLGMIGHGWVGTGCYLVAREPGGSEPVDLGPPPFGIYKQLLAAALDGARNLVARLGSGPGVAGAYVGRTADEASSRFIATWGP